MTDERKLLYDNYLTGFKDFVWVESKIDLSSLKKHYKIKLLPYILEYGKNANILELGCGSGYTLEFLKDEGFINVMGIDISKEQIEKALSKKLVVERFDVFEFFKKNEVKYNIIIALDFIEHFKKDELQSLFDELRNHLHNHGILIIRTPNGQGIFSGKIIYGDLTHYTIFNPTSLMQILKLNGFDEINFFENSPVAKNIRGFIRKISWHIIKYIYNFMMVIEQGGTEKIITQDFYCIAKKVK